MQGPKKSPIFINIYIFVDNGLKRVYTKPLRCNARFQNIFAACSWVFKFAITV